MLSLGLLWQHPVKTYNMLHAFAAEPAELSRLPCPPQERRLTRQSAEASFMSNCQLHKADSISMKSTASGNSCSNQWACDRYCHEVEALTALLFPWPPHRPLANDKRGKDMEGGASGLISGWLAVDVETPCTDKRIERGAVNSSRNVAQA
jgi:hypothetical protein